MKGVYYDQKVVKSIIAIVGNNTTEGTGVGVDLAGYEGALMTFNIGASGDTLSETVYMTVKLQESDDDSTYTDVAAGDYEGTQGLVIDAAAEDEIVHAIGYKGHKRYIRAYIAFTGTHTNGTPIAAQAILSHARHAPISY